MPSVSQRSVAESLKRSTLKIEEKQVVERLVIYLKKCDRPPAESINYLHLYPLTDVVDSTWFKHFSCLSAISIQLLFEFSKFTPCFDTLEHDDQLVLLKNCTWPMLLLMAARKYDLKEDTVVFTEENIYTREMCYKYFPVDAVDEAFLFFQNFQHLCIDEVESALLRAIILFSEHPAVTSQRKVTERREFYMNILQSYVKSYMPLENYLTSVLSIIDELFAFSKAARARFLTLVEKKVKVPIMILDAFNIKLDDDTKE